ncbi:MAG: hypothetical protein GC164_11390 [Phycisphaera sp.]|nr:hypothetical protein [Phycisphaera sp.]
MPTRHARISLALLLLCFTAGCQYGNGFTWFNPAGPDEQTRKELAAMVYPSDAPVGQSLDIITQRDGSSITLDNRTPRSYENAQLWLNEQYVSLVGKITIGRDNRFTLTKFINMHGESFPVAGFLAPDRAFPVVSAVLVTTDADGQLTKHPLTVLYHEE